MSEMSLAVINSHLARASIPVTLTPDTAARLKTMAPRDRLLQAMTKAPADKSERTWLIGIMSRAGLYLAPPSAGETGTKPPQGNGAAKPAALAPATTSANTASGKDTGRSPAPGEKTKTDDPDRLSLHVYGSKSALCFEADVTRDQSHTVSLDAAMSVGERKYDWSNKIRLQMTVRELPVVAAVFLGLLPGCEFKNHGPNNDKGFSMECQTDKGIGSIFVRVFAKDQPLRAVKVDAADAWRVGTLLLRQLRRQSPWMDGQAILLGLRALSIRVGSKSPAPRGDQQ